jgi:hypothetical protein
MGRARDIANIINSGTFITPASASASYLTASSASSTYLPLTGGTLSGSVSLNGFINSGRVGFKATLSSQVSLASNSLVPYNQTYYNYGNNFNTSTSKFTVPYTGFYHVDVQARIESSTDQYLHATLNNDTTQIDQLFALEIGSAQGLVTAAGSMPFYLTAGTPIHLKLSWGVGGTMTLIGQNHWAMTYLG